LRNKERYYKISIDEKARINVISNQTLDRKKRIEEAIHSIIQFVITLGIVHVKERL